MTPANNPPADDAPDGLYRPGRRDMLKWLGIGGLGSVAGCTGGDDTSEDGDGAPGGSTTTSDGVETSTPTATPAEADRQVRGDYVAASSTDAESLNWLTIADSTSGSFIGRILDGAWAIAPDQRIFPLWAEPSTDDGRVYEITLRDDLQWGAGYGQMTADDWVYMIQNVFQAEGNWSGYPNTDDWFRGGEPIPVEKTGTLTFTISLPEVDPAFPFKPVMWGQHCMPQGLLEKYVPDKDAEGLKQDPEVQEIQYGGNLGPYRYEQWQRESKFTTVRNEDYYLKDADIAEEFTPEKFENAPYFERSIINVIKEESSRLGALESGGVTSAGIPPNKAQKFKDLGSVSVNVTPQPFVSVLAYNQRANGWTPFRRKDVRQALAHAVDKQAIAQNIERGFAQVAQTMQPRWTKWYDGSQITEYGVGENYGPERTRSALESALSDTQYEYDGETLVDGEGKQVQLSLYFDQGQNTEKTTAEFIAQEFGKNAGIQVNLNATSSFISKFAANSPPEDADPEWSAGSFNGGPREVSTSAEPWDMSVNLGFNTYPYTPSSSKDFFVYRGTINYYGYKPTQEGERIAELYEEASRTVDEAERRELFGEAFGLINDEQPFGFLVMSSSITGYQDELVGPIADFASGWDSVSWYFEQ